jgi:hypothetical protein
MKLGQPEQRSRQQFQYYGLVHHPKAVESGRFQNQKPHLVTKVHKYWDSITVCSSELFLLILCTDLGKTERESRILGQLQAGGVEYQGPAFGCLKLGPLEYCNDPDEGQPGLEYEVGQHGGYAQGGRQGLYHNSGKGIYGPNRRGYPPGGY